MEEEIKNVMGRQILYLKIDASVNSQNSSKIKIDEAAVEKYNKASRVDLYDNWPVPSQTTSSKTQNLHIPRRTRAFVGPLGSFPSGLPFDVQFGFCPNSKTGKEKESSRCIIYSIGMRYRAYDSFDKLVGLVSGNMTMSTCVGGRGDAE
ncbi:hypothetical protein Nepgr_030401 [Nepenthes gracilis]|uniref:Uncharacterized protein n=1 Tax=Nepenthes gracilis TaxID=150966 RepID=A0AAD3Y455_NEPGR|nr:hypothetical protein Nepgr_030401 [Nepenthes gracilis]